MSSADFELVRRAGVAGVAAAGGRGVRLLFSHSVKWGWFFVFVDGCFRATEVVTISPTSSQN
jgi:hypothetical protein